MDCENCGAALPPGHPSCAYCGNVSATRAQELERQRQERDHLARSELSERERRLLRSSTLALVFGAVGILISCFPLPTVGAFVLVADAHKRARQLSLPLPARARLGLIFAVIGALLFVGFWAWLITDMEKDRVRASTRKAELTRLIASRDKLDVLTEQTACQLAELHVLNEGFEGDESTNYFVGFDCAGRLALDGERAKLPDFRFRTSSTRPVTSVTVCFKRGSRWLVSELSRSGDCRPR
jgi:hypothetical protein